MNNQIFSGQWGLWSAFSTCSAKCGPGNKSRDRVCLGETCADSVDGHKQTETCNDKNCGKFEDCQLLIKEKMPILQLEF